MKVKEILSLLPKYPDGSAYDVTFVKKESEHTRLNWSRIDTYNQRTGKNEFSDELLNAEIESIEAGRVRPGGHFNPELHIYVILPENTQGGDGNES